MKAGTEELLKFHEAVARLGIDPPFVAGLLDFIWKFAAKNCPRGDVGRYTNQQIGMGIKFTGDIDKVIGVLTDTGWLDPCECAMRLVIHDWADHAEDSVHRKLARARQWFWDGRVPNISRLDKKEKAVAEMFYGERTCEHVARRAAYVLPTCSPTVTVTVTNAVTVTATKPLPTPDHASVSRESGVDDSVVTEETIRDVSRLRRWWFHDRERSDAICERSEAFWVELTAAAAKASTCPGITDRVGFFKWIVKGRRWSYLRIADEELAARLRRDFGRGEGSIVLRYLPDCTTGIGLDLLKIGAMPQ